SGRVTSMIQLNPIRRLLPLHRWLSVPLPHRLIPRPFLPYTKDCLFGHTVCCLIQMLNKLLTYLFYIEQSPLLFSTAGLPLSHVMLHNPNGVLILRLSSCL